MTGGDLLALVPADRAQRAIHPQGPNFDNRLPQTLANGTVRTTPITDAYNYTPRGFITGPGNWNTDISVFKWFDITETVRLRFTADFFNAFNHPVDIDPNYSDWPSGHQSATQPTPDHPALVAIELVVFGAFDSLYPGGFPPGFFFGGSVWYFFQGFSGSQSRNGHVLES